MDREPAVIIGAVEALVISIVALVSYLLGWSAEATALVGGVIGAATALAGAVFVRSRVTPAS